MKKKEIIIVSGLQRSGTSMMMQMLEAGGVEVVYDDLRKLDEFNQKGYYELRAAKNLNNNNEFLKECTNKCLKVYATNLQNLPNNFDYKIIFVSRNIDEVVSSLRRMNMKENEVIIRSVIADNKVTKIKNIEESALNLLKDKTNVKLIQVDYNEILAKPELAISTLQDFLEVPLFISNMIERVLPEMQNFKLNKKLLRLDRSPKSLVPFIECYTKDKVFCEIGIGKGDNLNLVSNAQKKFGVENHDFSVKKCNILYPHLEIVHDSIFNQIHLIEFEVCYLWLTYPKCEAVVDLILKYQENCSTIIFGLNYYYHLEEHDKQYKKMIKSYTKLASPEKWNDYIDKHLDRLITEGYHVTVEQIFCDETDHIFNVAIVSKKLNK